jgi:transcriptional regulator with XRE-family HTH domain
MARLTFDPQSLYDALDAQRRQRGMTWQDVSDELRVSASTMKRMTSRRWGIELDGVAAMTRWLGRTVESFAGADGDAAPHGIDGRFLRFQTKDLFTALNDQRARREMTWDDVAAEIWPSGPWGARQLTKLAKGGRIDVQSALNACQWLGSTIRSFQRETWL